jgi:hypothetical protein
LLCRRLRSTTREEHHIIPCRACRCPVVFPAAPAPSARVLRWLGMLHSLISVLRRLYYASSRTPSTRASVLAPLNLPRVPDTCRHAVPDAAHPRRGAAVPSAAGKGCECKQRGWKMVPLLPLGLLRPSMCWSAREESFVDRGRSTPFLHACAHTHRLLHLAGCLVTESSPESVTGLHRGTLECNQ